MYIFFYIYIYTHICMYIYLPIYLYISIYIYTYIYVYIYIYKYIHTHIYICIYICVCISLSLFLFFPFFHLSLSPPFFSRYFYNCIYMYLYVFFVYTVTFRPVSIYACAHPPDILKSQPVTQFTVQAHLWFYSSEFPASHCETLVIVGCLPRNSHRSAFNSSYCTESTYSRLLRIYRGVSTENFSKFCLLFI